jgi:peptidyl-dipeptidase Dcp
MDKVQNEMTPILEDHSNSIMLNDALFARVKAVYDKRNSLKLDEVQMRLTEKTYNDFVRSGALLEGENKERLKQLNSELAMLTVDFNKNLLAENAAFTLHLEANQVADLPEGVQMQAREAADAAGMTGYLFTLDKPSMLPFLTYSSNRELRRELYNGYLMRGNNDNANDNKEIAELLSIVSRSVLMLHHRFRQKNGMASDNSLENFIEEALRFTNSSDEASIVNSGL